MKYLIGAIVGLMAALSWNVWHAPTNIRIKGYKDGVVICGVGLIVNKGHYRDAQVNQLIEMSNKQCKGDPASIESEATFTTHADHYYNLRDDRPR